MLVEATVTTNAVARVGSIVFLNPYQIRAIIPPKEGIGGDGDTTRAVIVVDGLGRVPVKESLIVMSDRFRQACQFMNTEPRGYGGST